MKICSKCKTMKSTEEFGSNKARKDGFQSECKECRRETNRAYYLKSPEQNASRMRFAKQRKIENRIFVTEYLSTHPCVDCGFSDIRALDFDHVLPGKTMHVSNLVSGGYPLKRVVDEIALCEVRCANCHRIITRERELGSIV